MNTTHKFPSLEAEEDDVDDHHGEDEPAEDEAGLLDGAAVVLHLLLRVVSGQQVIIHNFLGLITE